jgi:hypothetical protein
MSINSRIARSRSKQAIHWLLVAKQDPTLFTATLFHALSHKRTRWLLSGGISNIFRPQDQHWWNLCYMESIKLLNRAIQDPTYAVTDTVIMSVLIMAYSTGTVLEKKWNKSSPFQAPLQSLQWLNVLGAQEAHLAHVAGLSKLITLKGGMEKITVPGVTGTVS